VLSAGVATFTTSSLPVQIGYIVADYAATTNYMGSSITVANTVSRSLSRTLLTASPRNSTLGAPVTYKVVVSSDGEGEGTPTGLVTLYREVNNSSRQWIGQGNLKTGGILMITTTDLPLGSYRIIAEYRGSATHRPSARSMTQTVTG
jgi:hypothetical protein